MLRTYTLEATRQEARRVFPLREGMDRRQVVKHRRKWISAARYLGDKWLVNKYVVRGKHEVVAAVLDRSVS